MILLKYLKAKKSRYFLDTCGSETGPKYSNKQTIKKFKIPSLTYQLGCSISNSPTNLSWGSGTPHPPYTPRDDHNKYLTIYLPKLVQGGHKDYNFFFLIKITLLLLQTGRVATGGHRSNISKRNSVPQTTITSGRCTGTNVNNTMPLRILILGVSLWLLQRP